jgi:hypothetical protein
MVAKRITPAGPPSSQIRHSSGARQFAPCHDVPTNRAPCFLASLRQHRSGGMRAPARAAYARRDPRPTPSLSSVIVPRRRPTDAGCMPTASSNFHIDTETCTPSKHYAAGRANNQQTARALRAYSHCTRHGCPRRRWRGRRWCAGGAADRRGGCEPVGRVDALASGPTKPRPTWRSRVARSTATAIGRGGGPAVVRAPSSPGAYAAALIPRAAPRCGADQARGLGQRLRLAREKLRVALAPCRPRPTGEVSGVCAT